MCGGNGVVVDDPADTKALAEAVALALEMDEEEVRKTDEMILPGFSWEKHIQNLTRLYQEVLQGKKGGNRVLSSD